MRLVQLLRSWAETMPLTANVAATAINWSAGDHWVLNQLPA